MGAQAPTLHDIDPKYPWQASDESRIAQTNSNYISRNFKLAIYQLATYQYDLHRSQLYHSINGTDAFPSAFETQ